MRLSPLTRFIAASGLTNLADGVSTLAWGWLASLLTRDALLIALVPVALRLPWFLFALPAGIITDRVDRRLLIMGMDVIRGLAFAAVAVAVILALPLAPPPARGLGAPVLFLAVALSALVVGTAEVFRDNAAQTMLPALVPHDRLERANGRLWSVEMLANALIGPALGAVLIAAWVPLPFALNSAAYVLAVAMLWHPGGAFRPDRTSRNGWQVDLAEGLAFLRGIPLLRVLALTTGVWNLLHQMMFVALVLHGQENLGFSAQVFGLVLAGGATGGIAGSLLGPRIVTGLGPARTMQWMLAATCPAFAIIAVAPGPWGVAFGLCLMEFTGLTWNIVSVSMRQRMIPDALLGRVNSIYRLLAWGMMPLGLVLSGLIVRQGEAMLPRAHALPLPIMAASLGGLLLTLAAWRALARGFAARN